MKTSLLNQQKTHPVRARKIKRLADWLGCRLEDATAPDCWSEVCIILVGDDSITQTNREYFGKNRPTDVISFRYDPVPGEELSRSGDLIINVDRAVQVGPDHHGINYELALYIAHGFDHLTGAEDCTDTKRKKMRATETAWLQAAGDLIDGLFERS